MSPSKNMWLVKILVSLSVITSASAFGGMAGRAPSASQSYATGRSPFPAVPSGPAPFRRSVGQEAQRTTSSLLALIYGWDGDDDIAATEEKVDYGVASCAGAASSAAAALAETISFDEDRVGSLARLAAAFSPPERALKLKDIEKVEVLCVSENRIEIEAVVCEDGGCVSLAVPVSFPQECGSEWLEGCVMRNLDELDFEAESVIKAMEEEVAERDDDDLDDLCELSSSMMEYPSWWVPPECDAALVAESDTIRRLLNDDEFQNAVKALAQRRISVLKNGDGYEVKRAVVTAVGPAGICLKVRAAFHYEEHRPIHILDVLVPFGGEPMQDAESMRAAVLGAVMAAES